MVKVMQQNPRLAEKLKHLVEHLKAAFSLTNLQSRPNKSSTELKVPLVL